MARIQSKQTICVVLGHIITLGLWATFCLIYILLICDCEQYRAIVWKRAYMPDILQFLVQHDGYCFYQSVSELNNLMLFLILFSLVNLNHEFHKQTRIYSVFVLTMSKNNWMCMSEWAWYLYWLCFSDCTGSGYQLHVENVHL